MPLHNSIFNDRLAVVRDLGSSCGARTVHELRRDLRIDWLHSGQLTLLDRNQRSMHSTWNLWPQGSRRKGSPGVKSLKHTEQQVASSSASPRASATCRTSSAFSSGWCASPPPPRRWPRDLSVASSLVSAGTPHAARSARLRCSSNSRPLISDGDATSRGGVGGAIIWSLWPCWCWWRCAPAEPMSSSRARGWSRSPMTRVCEMRTGPPRAPPPRWEVRGSNRPSRLGPNMAMRCWLRSASSAVELYRGRGGAAKRCRVGKEGAARAGLRSMYVRTWMLTGAPPLRELRVVKACT
mmetsp:Transcript_419/g.744  ORF Transcript_419/g.744 Transcript_419/m.744 type:complete len:295 (+) Transcript_419:269-1153(+)